MNKHGYNVFCTDDDKYHLTTRRIFRVLTDAEEYVKSIHPSRNPIIIGRDQVIRAATEGYKVSPEPEVTVDCRTDEEGNMHVTFHDNFEG